MRGKWKERKDLQNHEHGGGFMDCMIWVGEKGDAYGLGRLVG